MKKDKLSEEVKKPFTKIEKENSKTKLGYYNLPSTGYDGKSRRRRRRRRRRQPWGFSSGSVNFCGRRRMRIVLLGEEKE